jgi:hypothetical protein
VIDVGLEIGAKRAFASALDWPGWSRAARDEEGALQALFDYRSRYRAVVAGRRLGFVAPKDASVLRVVERIPGDATTDFGAPGRIAKGDRRRTTERDVRRLKSFLIACWAAFDEAAGSARGRRLRTGARGGGRSLTAIVRHVDEADAGYLARIGGKADRGAPLREQILEALTVAPRTGTPPPGPRGGTRWPVRYHVRRSAWHALDHAWEIEDRLT